MTKATILQNKRDKWENQIKIAKEHQDLCMKNFHMYKNETSKVITRYEKWLERNAMEALLNLNQYK
jgi:hypothetical protein